uniref:DUF2428 domain-containing protein n=1 Tax=Trichuris muris TaxID=70415 RepID=A0A5S6QYV7_TRIMR
MKLLNCRERIASYYKAAAISISQCSAIEIHFIQLVLFSEHSFSEAINISRILISMLNVLWTNNISLGHELLKDLLNYVWNNWNRDPEAVRSNCCFVVVKTVKFHNKCCLNECRFVSELLEKIALTDDCVKSKYRCLKMMLPILANRNLLELLELNVPNRCLQAIEDSEVAGQAKALFVVMARTDALKRFSPSWENTWLDPVFEKALNGSSSSNGLFSELLTKLLRINMDVFLLSPWKYLSLDKSPGSQSGEHVVELYLTAARICLQQWRTDPRSVKFIAVIDPFLFHQNRNIAIEALRLMVDHPKPCLPVGPVELNRLLKFIAFNAGEQESAFCEGMIACMRKVFDRLKVSAHRFVTRFPEDWIQISVNYKSFLENLNAWAIECLVENLQFPSRYCALRIMELMYDRKTWCCPPAGVACPTCNFKGGRFALGGLYEEMGIAQLCGQSWVTVFEALTDCYDRNQTVAFRILRQERPFSSPPSVIIEQYDWALSALPRSLKLLEVSAAAYMIRIGSTIVPLKLGNVRETLVWSIAKLHYTHALCMRTGDLKAIASRVNIFGTIMLLRIMLQQAADERMVDCLHLRCTIFRIARMCFEIAARFLPVLQDGYCGANLSATDDDFLPHSSHQLSTNPRVLTLVSWRIIKETNALFFSLVRIVTRREFLNADQPFVTAIVKVVCHHFFSVFVRTNHRGLFETAALVFSEICTRMTRSEALNEIRRRYVQLVLRKLDGSKTVFRVNMRSGGLPFMVSCVLCSFVKEEPSCCYVLDAFVERVIRIAESTSVNGIKVNCLNILDNILRNGTLADILYHRLFAIIKLAFAELASDDWMVRSAAQLLFAAWVPRVFDTPTVGKPELFKICRMSDVELHRKYKGIFDMLVASLRSNLASKRKQCSMDVFASLLLLCRVYPSSSFYSLDTFPVNAFRCPLVPLWRLVTQLLLLSPIERLRCMAARTLVSILPVWKLRLLWKEAKGWVRRRLTSHNAINGLLHLVHTADQSHVHHGEMPKMSNSELLEFSRNMHSWVPSNSIFLTSILLSRGCPLPPVCLDFVRSQLSSGDGIASDAFWNVAARCAVQSDADFELFESFVVDIVSLRLSLYKVLAKNLSVRVSGAFPDTFQRLLLADVLESANEKLLRSAVKAYTVHSRGMTSIQGNIQTLQLIQQCKERRREQLKQPRSVAYFILFSSYHVGNHPLPNGFICWMLDSIRQVFLAEDSTMATVCLRVMENLALQSSFHLSRHCLTNVICMIMLQKADDCVRGQAANVWRLMHPINGGYAHPEQCLDECLNEISSSRVQRIIAFCSQFIAIEHVLQECTVGTFPEGTNPFVRNNFDCLLEAPLNLRRLLDSIEGSECGRWQALPLCTCSNGALDGKPLLQEIERLRSLCARGPTSVAHRRIVRHVDKLLEECAKRCAFLM